MGHAFDTGLDAPQRTKIRLAIAARLADLRKSANPPRYLAAIKSIPRPYKGEGDEKGEFFLGRAFAGQAPAVAIALGRTAYDPQGAEPGELVGELDVVVYVASSHARDLVDGRLAPDVTAANDLTRDPGVEVMLEHVRERLAGQSLGVEGVNELRLVEDDEAATFEDLTVFEQRYRVRVETRINPLRAETRVITSIETKTELDTIPDDEPGLDPLVDTITNLPPES